MTETECIYAGILLLSVLVSAVSQVFLKKEAMRPHASVIREYANARVICAYALFFISTLMTVLAYRGIPLSLGPVLEATSYIYVTAFGVLIFGEKVGVGKIIALALIITGIVVFAVAG
jgi:multidrug transporter EmrE-like cation transporter